MPIYRRICAHYVPTYLRWVTEIWRCNSACAVPVHMCVTRRCLCLRVFTGKREGVQAPGVGGQGLKPLPSQSYHQIAVGARAASLRISVVFALSLSLPLSLSASLSSSLSPFLSRVLFLAHFVRIHDLNSIAFYLLFRAPSRWWWNRRDQRRQRPCLPFLRSASPSLASAALPRVAKDYSWWISIK